MAAMGQAVMHPLRRGNMPIAEIARGFGQSWQTIVDWKKRKERSEGMKYRITERDAFMGRIESRLTFV
jgi:transposase